MSFNLLRQGLDGKTEHLTRLWRSHPMKDQCWLPLSSVRFSTNTRLRKSCDIRTKTIGNLCR